MRSSIGWAVFTVCLLFTASSDAGQWKQEHTVRNKYASYQHTPDAAFGESDAQQVITTLTGQKRELVISWLTFAAYDTDAECAYGIKADQLLSAVKCRSNVFVEPTNSSIVRHIHECLLTDLLDNQRYFYQLQRENITRQLHTMPAADQVTTVAVLGDFGVVNSQSLQLLQQLCDDRLIHAVYHNGDLAYDLHTNNGFTGDSFMNQIQPIASRVPYLTTPGNHEGRQAFMHYNNRLSLNQHLAINSKAAAAGANAHNHYYSVDILSGGATLHLATINTEYYYVYEDEFAEPDYASQREQQLLWLDNDLAAARARGTDWLIVAGHRPLYCSNTEALADCTADAAVMRHGVNGSRGIEDLLQQHAVDIYFAAHEHSYERTMPVFKGEWQAMSDPSVMLDAVFPVHVLSGSAGCVELIDSYDEVFVPAWSVVRSSTYGFGLLTVHNSSHLQWQQYLDEGDAGIDTMWMIKSKARRQQQQHDSEHLLRVIVS